MQNLQRDFAAFGMNGIGDDQVFFRRARGGEARTERRQPALDVWRVAAGDDQADTTARAFGEVGGEPGEIFRAVFQTGVHGAHQHAVFQRGETEIEGG